MVRQLDTSAFGSVTSVGDLEVSDIELMETEFMETESEIPQAVLSFAVGDKFNTHLKNYKVRLLNKRRDWERTEDRSTTTGCGSNHF